MSKSKTKWVASNRYVQFLHDKALISLELYRRFFDPTGATDYEVFWEKAGYFYLN